MHAIKGAWAGRTYALANSNDSGGRKPRIRRSKEERKELVVSFIKRHQRLHNGSFPSLNLTHKEVGGSFYTVREIIREVIQENRVLAPPKLLPGEQETNMESFLEQYPLGSISIDPQIDVVSSNESQLVVNHQQLASKDWVMDSRPTIDLDQGTLDNGTSVNGSAYEDVESKESKGPIFVDLLLEKGLESDEAGVKELDADILMASNVVDDVGGVTSSPEEHDMENLMEQGPIGASSIDHHIDVKSLDESEIAVSNHKFTNEEQVLDDTQVSKSDQGNFVNGIVNGSSDEAPEESDVKNFMEQGPTTISSIDRQIDEELVNESETGISYDNNTTNEEQVLDVTHILKSDQGSVFTHILKSDQGSVVNGTIRNGSSKSMAENEESKELIDGKSLLEIGGDGSKAEENERDVYQGTSQEAESIVVETFPLRPVPRMDYYDSDEDLNKSVVSVGALKKQDTESLQVETLNGSVPEKTILTKESFARDVNGSTELGTMETLPTGNKSKVAANGLLQQSSPNKAAPNKKQFDISEVGSSKTKAADTTLNRPKLESWESTSEKSAGKEADENPLMAFFKAFVTAFVKFWSD